MADDARERLIAVHRRLGGRRLLAPHWPRDIGGRGAPLAVSASVVQRLVMAGYTDTLIVNSVYNAGHALRRHGRTVHRGLLRRIAAGRSFAAVLFSEPDAGSDLTGVTSRCDRAGEGWILRGEKTWVAQADLCDHGICLARTAGVPGDIDGLSLFLVPLRQPGVELTGLDTTWSEPLFTVGFDGVRLDRHALIGSAGKAWDLVGDLLAMERASPGYWVRGARWHSQIERGTSGSPLPREVSDGLAHELAVAAALSDLTVAGAGVGVTGDQVDPLQAAMAKYRGALASQRVAEAAVAAGFAGGGRWLDEAVGLTIAAGTPEMMLRQIAPALEDLLDDPGSGGPAPVSRRHLHDELRRSLSEPAATAGWFARRGWTGLDVPATVGGEGYDPEAGAVLGYELGWSARGTDWLDAAVLADLLAAAGATARQRDRLRTAVADGTGAALVGAYGVRDWFDGAVVLDHADGQFVIGTHREHHTLAAKDVPLLAVPCRFGDRPGVLMLDAAAAGAGVDPDGDAGIGLDGALADPADVVAVDRRSWDALVHRARLRYLALLLGLAARALREALRAGQERVQFGIAVARQQTVLFGLADLTTRLVGARYLLWTSCREPRSDLARQYAAAGRLAREAALLATRYGGARSLRRDSLVARVRGLAAGMASHPVGRFTVAGPWHSPRPLERPSRSATGVDARAAALGLHGLFYRQAVTTPDAPAVVTAGATVTYRQLAARADDLAGRLAARSLPMEGCVAVALPPGIDLVTTILAVLRCGAAFLPLSLTDPAHHRQTLVASARPALVVTDRTGASLVPGPAGSLFRVDDPAIVDDPGHRQPLGPVVAGHPDRLAYIMFTSGSTGHPKGVMVSHRAIVGRLCWDWEQEPLGSADVVLGHTPIGFDPFIWEIFAPLSVGAAVYMASAAERADLTRLASVIAEQRVTALTALPTMVVELLRAAPAGTTLESLRLLYCGGENLTLPLARTLGEHTAAKLFNCYGLTETAVDAMIGPAGGEGSTGERGVLLGPALPGTRVAVRHDDGTAARPGVVGQLCVGGAGLARGYLGDARLTALRFRPDPAAPEPGARTFLTGDAVRRLRLGGVEFIGRRDDELKVRGHRFHPAAVESALREAGQVTDAVVGLVAEGDQEQLVAAVTVSGSADAVVDLRTFLQQRVPAALVPHQIAVLERLPVLPSGKVDRRAAVAMATASPGSDAALAGPVGADDPASGTDDRTSLVARTLGLPPAQSLDTDFFTLGGDSLQAARIVRALSESLGVPLSVGSLFAADSVADWLARAAERSAGR